MRMEVSDQKNTGIFAEKIASLHQEIQNRRPLVQCITNAVTVNDCANILLAAGASPTMAHHPQEAAEISTGCNALVCNFGAIADYEAMKSAALMATRLGHPIVIDPVGVSGSTYRRTKCIELIKKAGADCIRVSAEASGKLLSFDIEDCIRGNYSEIAALIKNDGTVVGVDAMQQQIDTQAMQEFARQNRLFLWASGETDILTDGERLWYCKNGDSLMARITGSGCMSSALLGAFLSIENSLESVAACCAFVGLAGELAAEKTAQAQGGTMTFRLQFIDTISLISSQNETQCEWTQ